MPIRNPGCDCGDDEKCNLAPVDCSPCCRCIPQRLCLYLNAPGCDCDGFDDLLYLDENQEYVGYVPCGTETADILIHLVYEDLKCYWRFVSESLEIDELFEIGSGDGMQSCEEPELVVNANFELCEATISVSRHELGILDPYIAECIEDPWCGGCECMCDVLCVDFYTGTGVERFEYSWDRDSRSWGSVALIRSEDGTNCFVQIAGFDLIPLFGCGENVSFYGQNSLGHRVSGKCKACSCDNVCTGCCLPMRLEPYIGLFPADIPFSVSAPNCPALNGHFNTFIHIPAVWDFAVCGICALYPSSSNVQVLGQRPSSIMMGCVTPCSFRVCFYLQCLTSPDDEYSADCCSQLRLVVSFTEPFEGTNEEPGPVACNYGISLAPTSCTCLPGGGLSAIFDLGSIALHCNRIIQSGPCYGMDDCCLPFNCDLEGATLVI